MNRAFLYGDGIFETIKIAHHKIVSPNAHYQRAERALEILGMQLDWSLQQFKDTVLKESIASGANRRVRITFFRQSGGLYTPAQTAVDYHIQHNPLPSSVYPKQEKGLRIGVCPHLRIYADQFANLKTCSATLQVQASRYRAQKGYDEMILYNHREEVAEGCAANIFVYQSDNTLITPPLSSGCLDGTMRRRVIRLAQYHNFKVKEASITLPDLLEAQEIWMTNAIQGLRWVEQLDGYSKLYTSTYAQQFQTLLNQKILV